MGLALLGAAAAAFIRDVFRTVRQPPGEMRAPALARAALAVVQDPANGWFPAPRQPVFSWEEGEQGWLLESEAPLALAPLTLEGQLGEEARPPGAENAQAIRGRTRTALRLSEAPVSEGKRSLAVTVGFPDPTTIFCAATAMAGVRFVAYDVYLPASASGYVGCLFFLKDKDGRWFQARGRTPLRPGAWTTLTADLRGGSPDVEPLGHLGQWDENQATQVQTIGLTFYGDQPYSGELYLDNFRGWLRADRFQQLADKPNPFREVPEERRGELLRLAAAARSYQDEPLRILSLRSEPSGGADAERESAAVLPQVGVYRPFTIRFELDRQLQNPFDPALADVQAQVTAPSGRSFRVFGFWYQDFEPRDRFAAEELTPVGRPEWRVRVTPREAGEHRVQVSVSLENGKYRAAAPLIRFVAVPSGERGFVRVSRKDPFFFEFEDGQFLYLLGHNVHTPLDLRCWTRIFRSEPPPSRGLKLYEDLFSKMQQAGENTAEVWMAAWWVGLEWTRRWPHYHGRGRYSLERAWLLDRLLELAREHGLVVHLVIDNHGKFSTWVDPEWDDNPYRSGEARDGVGSASEYFTDPTARQYHQRRLRYIAARWAGDPTILGWEVVSEFDLIGDRYGGETPFCRGPEAHNWLHEMVRAWRGFDPYGRPLTNHYSGDFNRVDRVLAESSSLDYVVGDAYRESPGYARMAYNGAAYFTQFLRKPFWVTEYGGNWNATSESRLKADLHGGLWSTWMTHYAGTPLFWWYDLVDRRDLYPHYRAFANYVRGEDRRGLNGETAWLEFATQDGTLSGLSYRWPRGAYAWVYDTRAMDDWLPPGAAPRREGAMIRIPGLQAGAYRVEFWDTSVGRIVSESTTTVQEGRPLELSVPGFVWDIAVKVKPGAGR